MKLLGENNGNFVSYSKKHMDIVNNGIAAIHNFLHEADCIEKRSLLFCLDRFLDPYYGYNLPNFDDIILILERQLFIDENDKDIMEDILQLLTDYAKDKLDYLAKNIENINPAFLADAIYAIGATYNIKYVPVIHKFENHENEVVREVAKNALIELSGR